MTTCNLIHVLTFFQKRTAHALKCCLNTAMFTASRFTSLLLNNVRKAPYWS